MINVSEFFKEIEFRVKSPLISSFLIAWLVINWEVVFGVLLYSNEALVADGFKSKIDLVRQYSSVKYFFWMPLASALVYVFVFPFVRYGIQFFQAWVNKWGSSISLAISKNGSISLSKYMELRKDYSARTNILLELIEKESSFSNLNEELTKQVSIMKQEKSKTENELTSLKEKSAKKIFEGYWKLTFHDVNADIAGSIQRRVLINSNSIYLANTGEHRQLIYTIQRIGYNAMSYDIIFILKDEQNEKVFHQIFTPMANESFDLLRNHEKDGILLSLERE
ncbi:hypothetical protein D3H65_30660 [Paraflavitalea soli]|uniref:Uncharacterized protein n=1 Tax=Paraflavitalea soli TaxID=2315862 RepID=A0A3B7MXX8_9BACT|nr:hypothetical protein [Paraflavitalea soli]AXY78089.1 hypothetical protein D3H65_30660 [Paraflavitalea soli]